MTAVFLGIGSNVNASENLRLAVSELRRDFGELRLSPVYRSAALGFDGDDFLNLVVQLSTDLSPAGLISRVEVIHDLAGRVRGPERFTSRPLDIDLLLYGDRVDRDLRLPRRDILEHGFVLRPLADIAPDYVHPETGRTIAAHWQEFDAARHPLTPVNVML